MTGVQTCALPISAGTGTIPVFWPLIAGLVGSLTGLYLLVAALATSAATRGQTQNAILLICPHFFEHAFSYLVVALVAGLTYESVRSATHPSKLKRVLDADGGGFKRA